MKPKLITDFSSVSILNLKQPFFQKEADQNQIKYHVQFSAVLWIFEL